MQYRETSHFLHFIMTCLTGGFWIIPWIIFYLSNRAHNDRIDMIRYQEGR